MSSKVWLFIMLLMVVSAVPVIVSFNWQLPPTFNIGDIVAGKRNIVRVSMTQFEALHRPRYISARTNGCPTIRCLVIVDPGPHHGRNVRISAAVAANLEAVKGDTIMLGEIIRLP